MQQVQDFDLAPNFPTSQSHWASVGCAGRTSPIHGSLTFQLQQRLAARYHSKPSEVSWSSCLDGSEPFWRLKKDLHSVRLDRWL